MCRVASTKTIIIQPYKKCQNHNTIHSGQGWQKIILKMDAKIFGNLFCKRIIFLYELEKLLP